MPPRRMQPSSPAWASARSTSSSSIRFIPSSSLRCAGSRARCWSRRRGDEVRVQRLDLVESSEAVAVERRLPGIHHRDQHRPALLERMDVRAHAGASPPCRRRRHARRDALGVAYAARRHEGGPSRARRCSARAARAAPRSSGRRWRTARAPRAGRRRSSRADRRRRGRARRARTADAPDPPRCRRCRRSARGRCGANARVGRVQDR